MKRTRKRIDMKKNNKGKKFIIDKKTSKSLVSNPTTQSDSKSVNKDSKNKIFIQNK
jgi:hypothetical protein